MAKKRTRRPAPPKPKPDLEAGDIPTGGLSCRSCGCRHLPVLYTRPHPGGKIKRVRECRNCGRRTTTIEKNIDGEVISPWSR